MAEVTGLPPSYVMAQLRGVDLLRGLDEDVLEGLCERVLVQDHEPGEVVIDQGSAAAGMHMVFGGTAIVERDGVPLAVIGPGEHVGEIALLDGQPRMATVRAHDRVRTGFLTSTDFLDMLEGHPELALDLLVTLATRFRRVEERLALLEASLESQSGD
jgi:CRP/FNR family cyclic AMP-dependent transcriptional regulator